MLEGKGLKVRLHFTKWGMVALAVMLAFGSIGVSYAHFGKGWGRGGNPFSWTLLASPTSTAGVQFSNQMPNDSATLTDLSVGDPAEPGTWNIEDPSFDIDDETTWRWSGGIQPKAKEVASIDCKIITVTDTNDTMDVTISNGYPYYCGNVAFTIDNKENSTGKVIGITLIDVMGTTVSEPLVACNDYYIDAETKSISTTLDPAIHDLSLHLSTIAVGQEIEPAGSAGDTLFGDIAVNVEQGAAQGAIYTFRIKIDFEGVETEKSDTAYAYGGGYATCFLNMENVQGNNWGWTNGPLTHGDYTFDLYAGAGGCIISDEKLVGTVDVDYDGSEVTVTYSLDDGYTMDATHLYIGTEPLPVGSNGKYITSPGQYPYQNVLNDATSDSYTEGPFSGEIYVVAHAVVFWFE